VALGPLVLRSQMGLLYQSLGTAVSNGSTVPVPWHCGHKWVYCTSPLVLRSQMGLLYQSLCTAVSNGSTVPVPDELGVAVG
jgi:hypothetical protein